MARAAFTVLAFLLLSSSVFAQGSLTARYSDPFVVYDGIEANTAELQSQYTIRVWLNADAPIVVPFTCTGTTKPFECKGAAPALRVGNNVIYLTQQPPPINGVQLPESPKSNPLVVFYAVNQKEIITNTERQTVTTIMCQEGSYAFFRITDAAKMGGILNGIKRPLVVSNMFSTDNAIYIFTCLPVSQ